MSALKASDEVIDFIAATNPDKVLAFRPSEATTQRVSDHCCPATTDIERLEEPYLLIEWGACEPIPPTGGFEPWPMVPPFLPRCSS